MFKLMFLSESYAVQQVKQVANTHETSLRVRDNYLIRRRRPERVTSQDESILKHYIQIIVVLQVFVQRCF